MEPQAGRRADGGRGGGRGGERGGERGDPGVQSFGLRINRPVGQRTDTVESVQSPSIQDILVALPADFDLQQAQQSSNGSAAVQTGGSWLLAQSFRPPEHRPQSTGVHLRADYRQAPAAAAQTLEEQRQSYPVGFGPDQWTRSGPEEAQAVDVSQPVDALQWQPHQKRRRTAEAAVGRQQRPVETTRHYRPARMPDSQSPSSTASDEDDDGSPLARAMVATRSQIDAMAMATVPSSSKWLDLEPHAKRKRPSIPVPAETSPCEPPRPPLHTASSNGSPASLAAQAALEDKPAAATPPLPPVPSEPQRAATVTASTSSPPKHQAVCRVGWCSQPGKRLGLCWMHGGVKRCCERNCARVALETGDFCSFHQPKHHNAGRTASI